MTAARQAEMGDPLRLLFDLAIMTSGLQPPCGDNATRKHTSQRLMCAGEEDACWRVPHEGRNARRFETL